jgi:hypothetical protein
MIIEGYLVVLKMPADIISSRNPRYKGLFRTPPWSQEDYEKGFNDPYVFGEYTNEAGLIPSLQLALEVLGRFTEVVPPVALEIIYAQSYDNNDNPSLHSANLEFLGYDVAGSESPFWSLVADFPLPEAILNSFFCKLNDSGLFSSIDDTKAYMEEYIRHKLPHYDSPWTLWRIYRVDNTVTS